MILALDLSCHRTGWAEMNNDGKLIQYGQITPNDKIHNFLKIKYVVNDLVPHMMDADAIVIEGIFLNTFAGNKSNVTVFELLARLSGAVINKWLELKTIIPILYNASAARTLVGVKSSSQKADVQLWVIRKFNLLENLPHACEIDLTNYDHLIEAAYGELKAEEIKRPAFKARMEKISKMIEEETFVGEDLADAILLGQAYLNDSRNLKV